METITHKGNIIEVVQKKINIKGKEKIFEYARRSLGTRLIIPKGNTILLSKEFRNEINNYDYRLPGGKVFNSLDEYNNALDSSVDINEFAKQGAIKEAKEEVGIEVKDLSLFHKSICGATVMWDLFYFTVNEFTETSQDLEEGEDITFEFVNKEKIKEMCLDGSISEERSALVLLKYLK